MITTKRLTWSTPERGWGVYGIEVETYSPKVYNALHRLAEMESIVERLNDPDVEADEADYLMGRLRSMAPYEPDPNGVEFFDGRRWRAC